MVVNYVHWLDLSTGEVEFRPAGSLWTPEASNWRLYIRKSGIRHHAVIQKPSRGTSSKHLIDIRSNTFSTVSSLLLPLESSKHITVTYNGQTLEVSLPRYRLSFFVNAMWELECRSMPGYVLDKTQTCGTMFGLKNKLILRPSPTSSEDSLLPRRVIIPVGDISFAENGNLSNVTINIETERHVRWHEYTIDTTLGCLTSGASLSSKLYQCYLHALTSHCLPDPLLGHTGTEEALYILRSASCRSFQTLDVHEAKLLELIGKLTPNRDYYPPHLQSMATVKWSDVPVLSQHHDFFHVVCSIFDHAHALGVLYDPPMVFDTSTRNQTLLNRAASRNKSYYPSDLQTSGQPSPPNDVIYRSRDLSDLGTADHIAFRTTWSIWNGRPSLDHKSLHLWDLMNSWGSLGPSEGEVSLRYSRYWLEFDAARDWFMIYDLCRETVNWDGRDSKVKLCFSLSAAAYTKSKYSDIVPFLMIFSLDERCSDLSPPPEDSYTLSDGLAPNLTHLENLVSQSALPIYFTPVNSLRIKHKQKKEDYNATIKKESTRAAELLLHQWPNHQHVDLPGEWFDKSDFNRRLDEYTQSIFRNIRLRDHALQLQSVLERWQINSIPIPVQYRYSPEFIAGHSKGPSYSLRDVLVSRADIIQTSTMEDILRRTGPDTLEALIGELRLSDQPLQEIYGRELKKSHTELLRQNAPQHARGSIPSPQFLLAHHEECSREKDKLFSDILAALTPSQIVEKCNDIAGLWPRITPRSLLSQLSRDRINKLPDQWRSVIIRYATSLLKYQHSLRLMELSLEQKHEELLRESEAIHNLNDVLAESTPDWLLIQVRPSLCRMTVEIV